MSNLLEDDEKVNNLSVEERGRIIDDIMDYIVERGEGEVYGESLKEKRQILEDMDNLDLVLKWAGTVGQWLSSRQDMFNEPKDTKVQVEEQFYKLIDEDREVDYSH